MKLKIQLQHPNAKAPTYSTGGASCFDLYAAEINGMSHIGDRVAQACLVPTPRVEFEVVEQLSLTERGAGGFGSSGV